MTAALEGGEWSASRPGRTLPPGKTRYELYRRLGGPKGWSWRAENLVPHRDSILTVQPLVSRYTDWATRPISPTSNKINSVDMYPSFRHPHFKEMQEYPLQELVLYTVG